MNEQLNPEDVQGNLSSLDRWVDAVKDVSLVSVGILASYASLAYGGTIAVGLAFVILAVSVLSSVFLPYKIAVTRPSVSGALSRYRALELMIVIIVSWVTPTLLILSDLGVASQLPPQSESRFVEGLLTFILPICVMFVVTLLGGSGLSKRVFGRVGFTNQFFEKYEKYPWGLGGTSLYFVSFFIVKAQLLLLEAVQTYAQSPDLAVPIYARAFGPIVVLVLLCCTLTYFEPERVLTLKGEPIFGLIGGGVFVALVNPVAGFVVSLFGVLVLIRYSSSLPPLDTEKVMQKKEESERFDHLRDELFKLSYPRLSRILRPIYSILFLVAMGGTYLLVLLGPVEHTGLSDVTISSLIVWMILYFGEWSLKLRLVMRARKSEPASSSTS